MPKRSSNPKRPTDVNQLAAVILAEATGQEPPPAAIPEPVKMPEAAPEKNPAAVAKTVKLSSGGSLSVSATADFFALSSDDRKFVFELIDKLDAYAKAHPCDDTEGEDPTNAVDE